MNRAPSVSICVPTYNGAAYLRRTLHSVLRQTLSDFELIVVDDASSDRTAEVIAEIADARLRAVRHNTNQGASATWNEAVSLARAPLVKLLCHDDTLEPNCLARQVRAMDDRSVELVSCWRHVIDGSDRRLFTRRGLRAGSGISRYDAVRAMVRSGTNPIGEPSATLFRKPTWEAVGGFDGHNLYMIDIDLWLKLLTRGNLCFVPAALCSYRVIPTALSTVLAKKQIGAGRQFMKTLVADPGNRLTRMDLWQGVTRATLRARARQLLYLRMAR